MFYTTPIKALSNQKYQELVDEWGAAEVGLLTGDTNINSGARIVVMTTEVLRNMLYADSPLLDRLAFVVMDEVHYLADRFRGAVWEEVIIHLPEEVRLVSLSATVSNAEEFGDWLQAVRGDTDVIVSEERPVPLEQHVLVKAKLLDLFDSSGQARHEPGEPRARSDSPGSGGRSISSRSAPRTPRRRPRALPPAVRRASGRVDRPEVVELLHGKNLLPGDRVRLPPRRAATRPSARCCDPASASPNRTSATRSARSSRSAHACCATRTWRCSATGSGSRASSAASPRTTPGCCPRSRRSSRSSSSGSC